MLRQREAQQREDLRAGIIAAALVNANPYRKRGSKPARPDHFFPSLLPLTAPRLASRREMRAKRQHFFAALRARAKPRT